MEQNNILYGKKLVAIGDSMVQGHSLSDADHQTWVSKIAARNGMVHKNYGMNGTSLAYRDVYDGQCKKEDSTVARYASLDDDADYILIFAGTNDIHNAIPLGDDNSTDATMFKGALNVLCSGLLKKYPAKKIGFITPYTPGYVDTAWELAPEYVQAIITICGKYNIPVFDNSRDGGIDWLCKEDVDAWTMGDTAHLNEAGMEYVSYKYEQFLRDISKR